MGLFDYFRNFFDDDNEIKSLSSCAFGIETSESYRTLIALASVKLISKTLSRAEFQTFEKGQEVKKKNYYLFNVEANQNTLSSLFWRQVVETLLLEGEALILIQDGKLYLASSRSEERRVGKACR